jgi:hypothetical protein
LAGFEQTNLEPTETHLYPPDLSSVGEHDHLLKL